jgi:GTP-binding protein
MDHNEDPSQFSYQVSEFALVSALNSLRFAQVVLLVVEGSTGKFSKLDLQLARKCLEEGRGLVIAANKKDLVSANGVSNKQYEDGVRKHCDSFMREFGDIPVIAVSGLENSGVNRILSSVLSVHDAYSKRIDTWVLNKWLKDLMVSQSAPRIGGKNVTIKYMTQVKSRPPTFALFTNIPELPGSYERFIRSRLQHDLSLQGVPIRFSIRKTTGRDVDKARLSQGMKTRRGVGHGESRPVGPKREEESDLRRRRKVQDTRRRRDTKQARARTGYK